MILASARLRPMVRMSSPICDFCCAKTCSTVARILDLSRFAAPSASERGLPLGFLRWMWLTRALDLSQASFIFDQYAVSAQTSEAVLSVVTTLRSCDPSWRAPCVTTALRMKP